MRTGAFVHENLKISWLSIKSNPLRTILTILIIAIGLMALVGILTAIDSITGSINSAFSMMGANTFTIREKRPTQSDDESNGRTRNNSHITYKQATEFVERYNLPASISIYMSIGGGKTIRGNGTETNPNISLLSADENYLNNSGYEIEAGRNFGKSEIANLSHVAIIGADVATKLFTSKDSVIGKFIHTDGGKYKVVGLLKSKSGMTDGGTNRMVIIPITLGKALRSFDNSSFSLLVKPTNPLHIKTAPTQAEGLFRTIRNLKATDATDFRLLKSDALAKVLLDNLKYVRYAATLIGLITLLGAAVGLMNIMLVAVAERTQEIGTRKALGAKSHTIKQQFLFESIMICLTGGCLGIILGIILGSIVAAMTDTPFVLPYKWIGLGFALSFCVGLASGYFPAVKASKLDPIEALRYE